MIIKGARTISEYKEIQKNRIQKWVDDRFISGSVQLLKWHLIHYITETEKEALNPYKRG